jgi:four helix bundle protein
MGSSEETRGWLDFALGCGYIDQDERDGLDKKYDEVNAMLYSLMNRWESL